MIYKDQEFLQALEQENGEVTWTFYTWWID